MFVPEPGMKSTLVTPPAIPRRRWSMPGITAVEARHRWHSSQIHIPTPVAYTLRQLASADLPAAITFLLSPAAAYITGETICIDGGSQFHKSRFIRVGDHRPSTTYDGFHLRPELRGTPFEKFQSDD